MKLLARKPLLAAAPALGAGIAIAIFQTAHLPFPPPLSLEALPQWALFAAAVHTATSLCLFVVSRLFGDAATPGVSRQVN